MTQLKEAVALLKQWRSRSPGQWKSAREDDRTGLETKTDDFLERYRVSLDG